MRSRVSGLRGQRRRVIGGGRQDLLEPVPS